MAFLGLTRMIGMVDNYVNQRILNDLEKITGGDDLQKIKTLATIITPDERFVKNTSMGAANVFISSYQLNIEEQIKELKKLCFYLKNNRKISAIMIATELKEIPAYSYFTSSDKYFIDAIESMKTLIDLIKEFYEIIVVVKESKNHVDLENYYALRSYISNMAFHMESLARVVMKK